jgi:argininosuccinate synthase
LEGLEKKAKASGACQLVVKDLKEEFVSEYIYPCLRAGAVYERKYLLGTSMARPVIAKVKICMTTASCRLGMHGRGSTAGYTIQAFIYNLTIYAS